MSDVHALLIDIDPTGVVRNKWYIATEAHPGAFGVKLRGHLLLQENMDIRDQLIYWSRALLTDYMKWVYIIYIKDNQQFLKVQYRTLRGTRINIFDGRPEDFKPHEIEVEE